MPNRIIRAGINSSDKINSLDWAEEVFYRRLLNAVDDHGLFDARPSILRASLYPLRIDRVREADITRWIAACEKAGLILLYEADEKQYLQILNTQWKSRSEPKYPMPNPSSRTGLQTIANNCKQLRPYSETETETNSETKTLLRASETSPFQSDFADETQPQPQQIEVEALSAKLREVYKITGAAGWKLDGTVNSLAVELHAMSATPAELESFWNYRTKKPAPQYLAQDFIAWRAGQQEKRNGKNRTNGGNSNGAAPDRWRSAKTI